MCVDTLHKGDNDDDDDDNNNNNNNNNNSNNNNKVPNESCSVKQPSAISCKIV
jgi:hypothetical protein